MNPTLYQTLKKIDRFLSSPAEYSGFQTPVSPGINATGEISCESLGTFKWTIHIPGVKLDRYDENITTPNLIFIRADIVYAITNYVICNDEETSSKGWYISATLSEQPGDVENIVKQGDFDISRTPFIITSITRGGNEIFQNQKVVKN